MGESKSYERVAWVDRFQKPSTAKLREALPAATKSIFDAIRKRLNELSGVKEDLSWYGDSWHWVLEYRTRHSNEPLALLIPCPTDLQLALPLDREFTRSLPIQRMKRAIRDGLELAQEPFDTRWGVWTLAAGTMLDDLQDLVELKLSHLSKRAG
jgi:hypothetical protein